MGTIITHKRVYTEPKDDKDKKKKKGKPKDEPRKEEEVVKAPYSSEELAPYLKDKPQGIEDGKKGNYIKSWINGVHISNAGSKLPHSEKLDPKDKNISVGLEKCTPETICVPKISIHDDGTNTFETDTMGIEDTLKDINKLSDEFSKLKAEPVEFTDPNSIKVEPDSLVPPIKLEGYEDLETNATTPLVTDKSVPCLEKLEYSIPELSTSSEEDSPELKDLLKKLEELTNKSVDKIPDSTAGTIGDITDTTPHGVGAFDKFMMAIFNQLEHKRNLQLLTSKEVRDMFTTSLPLVLEQSIGFILQREQSKYQSSLVQAQIAQVNAQVLMTKAELLLAPTKLKLAYAELKAKFKELDLLRYQIEVEKQKIHQIVAQTDQIRELTSTQCVQRKLALEQLAQAEFDRKIKANQVVASNIDNQIKSETLTQSKQATKLSVVGVRKAVAEVDHIKSQIALAHEDIMLKKAEVKTIPIKLKLQAQELLKAQNNVALTKAQVRAQLAGVALTKEQIKVQIAHYSNTVQGEELGGVLGAQMNVNIAQKHGFDRTGFNQFYTHVVSGWNTKKTVDMATLSPQSFTAEVLDNLTQWYGKQYFNVPQSVFKVPKGYSDYVTDAQMDGEEPTPIPEENIIDSSEPEKEE